MNRGLKSFLQRLKIYHPLQSSYRAARTWLANQFYKSKYRHYKGAGFTCNFCGAVYQRFVPEYPTPDIAPAIDAHQVIAGYGENVYCPQCLSKNRERLIKAAIENYIRLKPNIRILHFSPEKHLYTWLKQQTSFITTADSAPRFYTSIDPHIRHADATKLAFNDKSFDLVIANHILEHIPEDQKAMREIRRILADDGVAILQVPYSATLKTTLEDTEINDPKQQAALFGQRDHVRIYSYTDYIGRLRDAGFTPHILTPEDLAAFRIYAIQETESVFLAYPVSSFWPLKTTPQ